MDSGCVMVQTMWVDPIDFDTKSRKYRKETDKYLRINGFNPESMTNREKYKNNKRVASPIYDRLGNCIGVQYRSY